MLFVCQGPSCGERGGDEHLERLRRLCAPAGGALRVCAADCLSSCATGPNVKLSGDDTIHTGVQGDEAARALAMEALFRSRRGAPLPIRSAASDLRNGS